ncbi:MAG: RNA 2',3'-cyclic phosphodiesterase [bacterium]|nr:RNA 2',3'-cyclic phosphodiesterase [bacterium]
MLRLFIALPLPSEVERKLGQVIEALQPHGAGVKWAKPGNIHLTVKFLGDADESLVPMISEGLDRVVSRFGVIKAVIDQLGGFPNLKRPRVIWAGSSLGVSGAAKIAKQVDLAARQLGFAKEKRPFKAHLTLGRVRQGRSADDLAAHLDGYTMEPITMSLDRLVLFKSTLTPEGPIYDRLHESPLGQERFEG